MDKLEKETQALSVRLPADLHQALKTFGFVTQSTMNEVVVRAVANYLSHEAEHVSFDKTVSTLLSQYRSVLEKLADA